LITGISDVAAGGLDERRADLLTRRDEARVGEHDVGPGHVAARIHIATIRGRLSAAAG
jgi:hypothetical protein